MRAAKCFLFTLRLRKCRSRRNTLTFWNPVKCFLFTCFLFTGRGDGTFYPGCDNCGADFTKCNKVKNGTACFVTWSCAEGYTAPTSSFTPICSATTNQYDASLAGSCIPKNCTQPLNDDKSATYNECRNSTTGQSCSPECAAGYEPSAPIDLVCSDVQLGGVTEYVFDANVSRCVPRRCTARPMTDVAGIDFSSCQGWTGDRCSPNCTIPGQVQ